MKIMYIILICVSIVGIIAGCNLVYITLKYKNQFENYKKELRSDIIMIIIPLSCLIILLFTKIDWGIN